MLDGRPLVDVHLHAARLPTLKRAWRQWAHDFGGQEILGQVHDTAGTVIPKAFDAQLAGQGVDIALLLREYSDDVLRDLPRLDIVLAHDGRGWRYDAAAFLALSNERVWIELSGYHPRACPSTTPSTTAPGSPDGRSSVPTGRACRASRRMPAPSPPCAAARTPPFSC